MTHLYYCFSAERLDKARAEGLMNMLPHSFRKQILKFKKWEDQQRALIARCLLLEGLKDLNLAKKYRIENLQYTAFNRPFFNGGVDFNISHSGRFVICAISTDLKVGVDIEEIKEIPLTDFDYEFSLQEMQEILKAPDPMRSFYNLWTKKEAFLKAIGTGLSVPLNKIHIKSDSITWNDAKWFLTEIKLDEQYVSHLCTNVRNPEISINEISYDA